MNKNEIVLTELLNCNAISEQTGLTAKDMSEIVGFNAAAKLSELKARTLVSTTTKGILNVYWLTKAGIEKANSILTGAAEPDTEEAPQIEAMPTTGTNYEADLNRENSTLRNALEYEKSRVKVLEQNARELNARIAALESHQDLISEKGLLEQIADLELKLASLESADTFYTVNTGTNVLTFNDEEKAIESAHNEAQLNNEQATVEKIYRIKFGVAKPVKSTVWEVF
jgi:hypothetical protein